MSPSPIRTWDNTQALTEGWMIRDLRIFYYGLSSAFLSTRQAIDYVIAQATAGSDYHVRALAVIAAQDPGAGLSWITISGSYGEFKAFLDTGEVFDRAHTGEYDGIVKVDVAEVKLNFPNTKHDDHWDVTRIGCWYSDGSYEGPASGRQCWLDNIDHEDDLVRLTRASIVLKPYAVTVLATVPVWRTVDVMAPNIEEAKQDVELGDSWFIQGQFQPNDVDPDLLSDVEKTAELTTLPAPETVPEPTSTNQFIATIRVVVPAGSFGQACDFFSETLRECGLVNWGYINEGGTPGFAGPHRVLGAPLIAYDEDCCLERVWRQAAG